MNVPLTPVQADAIRDLEVRARRIGLKVELRFTLDWRVLVRVGDEEFDSIDAAAAHLSSLEVAA